MNIIIEKFCAPKPPLKIHAYAPDVYAHVVFQSPIHASIVQTLFEQGCQQVCSMHAYCKSVASG